MTPCHVLLGLQARRRKPRIIRYNHEHPGPAHDGRAQRRCPRICEHSYPSIYDDFVANFANVRNPPSGGQIAELTMETGAAGRIANSDETHHKLSNEGERGGSRANTQTDPDLPRTGRRKVANERHITGLHGTTETGASATTSSRRACRPAAPAAPVRLGRIDRGATAPAPPHVHGKPLAAGARAVAPSVWRRGVPAAPPARGPHSPSLPAPPWLLPSSSSGRDLCLRCAGAARGPRAPPPGVRRASA